MPRPDSAFAVIRRRGSVLLVKSRARSKWQLPGGGVEAGEAPWEAALREVDEETGLAAEIVGLAGIYRRNDASLAFVFLARVAPGAEPVGPTHEIAKQKWIPLPRALGRLGRGPRRRLLDAIRRPAAASRARIARGAFHVIAG